MDFEPFPKIPRLDGDAVFTEKLDGTNACLLIDLTADGDADNTEVLAIVNHNGADHSIKAASRKKLITQSDDNYGFAKWVAANSGGLVELGVGRHFGEWWGNGIQRRYGQDRKRFSLFNVGRWSNETIPDVDGLSVVPKLYEGAFTTEAVENTMVALKEGGSVAAPGFMKPEGIVIFHQGYLYKVTFEHSQGKWRG